MSIELTNSDCMAKLAMDKSILREYANNSNNRIVYLNNNDEFQIQLFNPESFTVGAEISVNGEILQGMLVIKPGQRIWLERPMMGNNKKFKFETYTVEDSAAVEKAIKNNGEIRIRFYKEYQRPITITTYQTSYPRVLYNNDILYSSDCATTNYLNTDNCCSKSFSGLNANNLSLNSDNLSFSSEINTLTTKISSNIETAVSNAASNTRCMTKTISANRIEPEKINEPEKAVKETGRIGSGSVSYQNFHTVDNEFETWAYRTETIKILPMSQKPFTNSDIQKKYCVNCGRKLNPKYKFCPYCGVKCD